MTISPERERQLCSWAANPADALRAIQFLLTRVRELEKREAELMELLKKTDVLLDQLEASDELSESYEAGIAEVHLPIIVALKGAPCRES